MKSKKSSINSSITYLRNFVFGVEDSLVSTVGLLSGIAVAGVPKLTIIVTGIVLIFVEAVSMAAGSLMSEYSADKYINNDEKISKSNYIASLVMFVSYFISGFFPLFPYLFLPIQWALYFSIAITIFMLFILGVVGAKIARINVFKNGMRMVIIGGAAIVVGSIAGSILSYIR